MTLIFLELNQLTLMCAYFMPNYTHSMIDIVAVIKQQSLAGISSVGKCMIYRRCIDDNTIYDANHVNARGGTRKTLALTSRHQQTAQM